MDAKYATEAAHLVDALDGLAEARKVLGAKRAATDFWLKVATFEGDDDGGSFFSDALVPPHLAPVIIAAAEKVIRDRLAEIGVTGLAP